MNWTPPENPDPELILDSAREDTDDGNYEIALEQFVWFHENVLSIRPSFYGVRLSYALAYWYDLGKVYPPAREKMIEIRDATVRRCREQEFPFEAFHDVCGFNRVLKQPQLTADLFVEADAVCPESAQRIYRIVEPALIATSNYSLCNPYLDWQKQFGDAMNSRQQNLKTDQVVMQRLIAYPLYREHPEFLESVQSADRNFATQIGTLIGLLVLNHRGEEAEAVKAKALEVMDNEKIRRVIEQAMSGVLPEQP